MLFLLPQGSNYHDRQSEFCESGGIGRRARLRIWYRKVWGFESPLSHHKRWSLALGLWSLIIIEEIQRPKTKTKDRFDNNENRTSRPLSDTQGNQNRNRAVADPHGV